MSEAIKKERRRREQRMRKIKYNGKELNPADFTELMGSYHDQNQPLVQMSRFKVEENFIEDIKRNLSRTKKIPRC